MPSTHPHHRRRFSVAAVAVASTFVVVSTGLAVTPAHATYSGANGQIAFRRYFNAEKTHGAVFLINPDGTGERQVTFPPANFVDANIDISPDGSRLAFERNGPVSDEVWVVDSDGSNLTRLTPASPGCLPKSGICDGQPAWSPDGTQLAFSRASGPVRHDLVQREAIYVMDADGSHVRRITQRTLPAQGEDSDPMWSPDGRYLVFERNNVRAARPADGTAVWVHDLWTGAEHRVSPWRLNGGNTPDWSPDGSLIIFTSNEHATPGVSANLYTVHPDGTHLHQLTHASGGVNTYLGCSFSPDGTRIVFGKRPATGGPDANAADVFTMWVDGTHRHHVTTTVAYDSYPDWGPAN